MGYEYLSTTKIELFSGRYLYVENIFKCYLTSGTAWALMGALSVKPGAGVQGPTQTLQ